MQEPSVIIKVRESELNSIVETMKILKGIYSLATDSKLLDDLKRIRGEICLMLRLKIILTLEYMMLIRKQFLIKLKKVEMLIDL